MKNWQFHRELRQLTGKNGRRMTVSGLARAMRLNRPHLTDVLNNKPNHGHHTRRQVVAHFKRHWPEQTPALLTALGWTENGEVFHAEQSCTWNNSQTEL